MLKEFDLDSNRVKSTQSLKEHNLVQRYHVVSNGVWYPTPERYQEEEGNFGNFIQIDGKRSKELGANCYTQFTLRTDGVMEVKKGGYIVGEDEKLKDLEPQMQYCVITKPEINEEPNGKHSLSFISFEPVGFELRLDNPLSNSPTSQPFE